MRNCNKTLNNIFLFIFIQCTLCFSQSKEIDTPFNLGGNISVVKAETFYAMKKNDPVYTGKIPNQLSSGDVIFIFVGCSGGLPQIQTKGWSKIISAFPKKDPGDVNVTVWYKKYTKSDSGTYKLKLANKTFITIAVLRGIDPENPVVDKAGAANTAKEKGLAIAPEVSAEKGGVTIAAFTFDDPYKVWVEGMHMISSWKQGDDGQAIAIKLSEKNGQTGTVKTTKNPQENPKGGGNEAAATITLRAKRN